MKKLLGNSVIVIWSDTYIDDPTYYILYISASCR